MSWYFKDSKGVKGPLTDAQIREFVNSNGIDPTATVRHGESSWVPAETVRIKFEKLDQEGTYLRSDDKIYGPFVARRADELRAQYPDRFDSYKIGKSNNWVMIEEPKMAESVRQELSQQPLLNSNTPGSPPQISVTEAFTPLLSLVNQTAQRIANDPRVHGAVEKAKELASVGLEQGKNWTTGSLSDPPIERPYRLMGLWKRNTPSSQYQKEKRRSFRTSLILLVIFVVGPFVLIWEGVLVRTYQAPSVATLWYQENSESIDSYEQGLKKLVAAWKVPDSITKLANEVVNHDFELNELRQLRFKQEQLETIRREKETNARYDLARAIRVKLNQILGSDFKDQNFISLFNITKESGKSSFQFKSEIETLVKDEVDGHKTFEFAKLLILAKELVKNVDDRIAVGKGKKVTSVPEARLSLETCLKSIETFETHCNESLRRIHDQSRDYFDRITPIVIRLKSIIDQTVLPKTPYDLGGDFPMQPSEPKFNDLDRVLINGLTHRVEGELYFIENKIIYIPESCRDLYVLQSISVNKVIVGGEFSFLGNRKSPTLIGRPIEEYCVPGEFVKKRLEYEEAMKRYKTLKHAYDIAEQLLEDKTREVTTLVNALNSKLTEAPNELLIYTEKLIVEASKFNDLSLPDFKLSADEKEIIQQSLAPLANWDFSGSTELISLPTPLEATKPSTADIPDTSVPIANVPIAIAPAASVPVANVSVASVPVTGVPTANQTPAKENVSKTKRKNYVKNGDFESDGDNRGKLGNWRSPVGWMTQTPNGNIISELISGQNGTHILNHFAPRPYEISNRQQVKLSNGKYTLTLRVSSGGGQQEAYAQISNYGGKPVRTESFGKTSGWTSFSIPGISVTNGKCEILIRSKANANQWLNVDDVTLIED